MSGLEKFQANKAWRAKVKKLLVMQRFLPHKIFEKYLIYSIKNSKLTTPVHVPVQCQRFSLDLAEDLQVFLEEKTLSREGSIQDIAEKMFETENDENKPNNSNPSTRSNGAKKYVSKKFSTRACYDETTCEDPQQAVQWQRSSDESFMALEKMCDKTASDPNSTLFQYIHSEDKELVVEDAKKRSAGGCNFKTPCKQELREIDEEAKSLQRLLHDLCVQEQNQLENETPLKCIDVTLLEDIEAPSKLWDTTIVGETTLQTSPVKMVGLLRPSTIIEECAEDESNSNNSFNGCGDVSSHMSFESAVKGGETSATSYYETAHDSTGASSVSKEAHILGNNEPQNFDKCLELINLDKTLEVSHQPLATAKELSREVELEQIIYNVEQESPASSFEDSLRVIELLSDEELDQVNISGINNVAMNNALSKGECATVSASDSLIDRDANGSECTLSKVNNKLDTSPLESDKDNGVFNDSGDHSLHFNDTMEEVEYMMKKGMQYMAAAGSPNPGLNKQSPMLKQIQIVQPAMIVKPLQEREGTFTYSPKKQNSIWSPSPSKKGKVCKPTAVVTGSKVKTTFSSPRRTPQTSAQRAKCFVMDMKPVPKLELFRKPTSAVLTRLKEPIGHKQFSHIVSPVGAYMKKTATTPLMTNLKQRSERPDVRNASVFRELEQETKVYQPKFGLTTNSATKTSSLPKKAYISSEYKHIVDERTPVTIPGGKKIQKYLENAMLPTVVRHEGKLKMSANEANRKAAAQKASYGNTTQRNNGSLANLSLMSGDISLYTMKDARKF